MAEYSKTVILAWSIAAAEAQAANAGEIEPVHLLLGLCKLGDLDVDSFLRRQPHPDLALQRDLKRDADHLRGCFEQAHLDLTWFRRTLRARVARPGPAVAVGEVMPRSQASRRVFQRAESIAAAIEGAGSSLQPRHLLQALLELSDAPWESLLAEMGKAGARQLMLDGVPGQDQIPGDISPDGAEGQDVAVEQQRRGTPVLDRYGRDLTQAARDGKLDPVIGRRDEMRSLARVLTRKRKNNAILVGDAGVGKTCIVEGLAQRIVDPDAPPILRDKRLIEVSMAALVAGTKYRGEFEERLQGVIDEASRGQDVILFIDEIHTVLGAGGEGASDAANILKPALARGDLRCIGATTIAEYRRHVEKDPALERRFQQVWVNEPTRQEAIEILTGLRPKYEEHHGLEITDAAINAAVELSMRYLTDFRLPDKAIDLIDQACAGVRIQTLSSWDDGPATRIGRTEVAAAVAQRCRLPVERLVEDEAGRLLRMEEELGRRVMGQDEAVRAVSGAIRTARAGLKDPRKPIGVFLCAGMTGTGKTELAKGLAEFLFDDERHLIRIDMSEYMEKHAVSRLIGAPPGYVGHEEEGQLTGAVRTHPFSVVLFDEIEKAHPEVLDICLQIFDDGHLTDARGRRVSFSETVILLTSNLGSRTGAAARPIGLALDGAPARAGEADREAYRQRIMGAVRGALRPELLNRVQQVLFFYPLTEDVVRRIIDKILDRLRLRLRERGIGLELTGDAYALLMQEGFDPQYGGREMERAIDRLVVQPLGQALLAGRFAEGSTVQVDARNGEMVLEDDQRTRPAMQGGHSEESSS